MTTMTPAASPRSDESKAQDPRSELRALIRAELSREILPAASTLAAHVRELYGESVGSILFYGSCLRADSPEGVMDLYLLTRSNRDFNPTLPLAAANRLIPPNIYFWSIPSEEGELRGKGAAISLEQFQKSCEPGAWSPSIWARFCQPVVLVDSPTEADREATVDAVEQSIVTAAKWAAWLGPSTGSARDYWVALFRATYSVELRPERDDRPGLIVDANRERYERLLPLAWKVAGISFEVEDGEYRPHVDGRPTKARGWRARRALGKGLSVARIVKGAFTFDGAVDYLLWKIERHSGVKVAATEWQKRHPFLAAPSVFAKLWRAGAIR
ncbi:MAG: hypothetical protein AAGE52_02665 [Myxococcota bacterium]